MDFLNKSWQTFRGTIRGFDSPAQLALGVTFGMMIGLIPHDSALPYIIGLMALLLNANLLCTAIAALLFSWLSPMLDPMTHSIGLYVLTLEPLQPTLTWMYDLPLVPWTKIDNTVVTGCFLLSILLAIPVQFISQRLFTKYGSALHKRLVDNRLAKWLIESPVTDRSPTLQEN